MIDAETFGKRSEIGDKEFSSRKYAFELRLRSRLLRRAVRQKDSPVARPEVSGPTQANVLLNDAGPGATQRAKIRITGNGYPILDREWRGPRLLTRNISDSARQLFVVERRKSGIEPGELSKLGRAAAHDEAM